MCACADSLSPSLCALSLSLCPSLPPTPCVRYAVSQRAQVVGQAVGLPTFMALFSFIGEARDRQLYGVNVMMIMRQAGGESRAVYGVQTLHTLRAPCTHACVPHTHTPSSCSHPTPPPLPLPPQTHTTGLAVTSATVVMFGTAVRDPVQLLSQLKQPVAVCVSLFGACRDLHHNATRSTVQCSVVRAEAFVVEA